MRTKFPYIEPTIRTIAGSLITLSGLILLFYPNLASAGLALLFFVSLNLAQSGFTRFCLMEKILRKIGFRSELDEIRDLNKAMALSETQTTGYLETLNMLNEVVIEISPDYFLIHASEPLGSLLGEKCSMRFQPGMSIMRIVAEQDRDVVHELLSTVLGGTGGISQMRFRLCSEGREEIWVEGKFTQRLENGIPAGIRGILRDVTKPHLQELQIAHMALHDGLTGLPNRTLLEDRMQQAILTAQREKFKSSVLFIDLDNFKHVNDIYGHKAGDQLLLEVSMALKTRLRRSDTLARWGGDEFVVLLRQVNDTEHVRKIADELAKGLQESLSKQHADYLITLSIGGAIFPDDALTAENLLIQADKALFFAKSQGRNNAQMYSSLRKTGLGYKDVDFTTRFSRAVKQELIQVHYQPIVDAVTHMPLGMEALARWHDDENGWVSPAAFIPMAENLGLIELLGKQVSELALSQFARCETLLSNQMFVSINISNRQLISSDFATGLIKNIEKHGVPPEKIKLEITESIALLGMERAREYLGRLSNFGFKLSLDDFGTGYSSLAYLHELPVDEIKIDMSFVRRIHTLPGRIMLKTIANLGRALKINVVAEGVESKEAAGILRDLGVDMLQGYYFHKPGPKEECLEYVKSCQAGHLHA